jgi:hypothetical protein
LRYGDIGRRPFGKIMRLYTSILGMVVTIVQIHSTTLTMASGHLSARLLLCQLLLGSASSFAPSELRMHPIHRCASSPS